MYTLICVNVFIGYKMFPYKKTIPNRLFSWEWWSYT